MTPADWTALQEVFHGAIQIPPDPRRAFVRARGLSPELQKEIIDLVESSTRVLDRLPTELLTGLRLQPGEIAEASSYTIGGRL